MSIVKVFDASSCNKEFSETCDYLHGEPREKNSSLTALGLYRKLAGNL